MTDNGSEMQRKRDTNARAGNLRGSGNTLSRIVIYGVASLLVILPMAAHMEQHGGTMRAYAAGTNASLSLPAVTFAQETQTIDLPILLNTDAAIVDAIDISLTFDPAMMLLSGITPGAGGTSLKTFAPVDSAYSFDVARVVSAANMTGKVAFGVATFDPATQSPTAGYAGTTQLAVLHFAARQGGSTTVAFNIGASTGSTIVLESNPPQNLLTQPSQVTNALINIVELPQSRPGGASGGPANPLPPSRSGVPTSPGGSPAPLPRSRP